MDVEVLPLATYRAAAPWTWSSATFYVVSAVLVSAMTLYLQGAFGGFLASHPSSAAVKVSAAARSLPVASPAGPPGTVDRYYDAVARLEKLKASGSFHQHTCAESLEMGWRQPANLVPRYIGNRCEPWWVRDVIYIMDRVILPEWKVWLSVHAASVTTIEDSGLFAKRLGGILLRNNITNVDLRLREQQSNGTLRSASRGCCFDRYISGAADLPDGTVDMVSVDGRAREHCLREAVRLVKPEGGAVVLDNYVRWRYKEAIRKYIPRGWIRHKADLIADRAYNLTEKQAHWVQRDDLYSTFWLTR